MGAVTQGPLKSFLDAKKAPSKLVGRVDRYLQSQPPDTSRRTDVLHPSEIVAKDWCLRRSYHLLRGAKPKLVSHPLRMANIFRTGHDIHEKWQGWAADAGVLYGDYKCLVCESEGHRSVVQSLGWPEDWCQRCESKLWKYDEVKISIPSLRIEGHTDGALIFGDVDPEWTDFYAHLDYLLEVKSVGTGTIRFGDPSLLTNSLEESFKKIRRPFASHQMQIQLYMRALKVEKALVLYECKADQSTKEFELTRNNDLIEPILDKAEFVVAAAESGEEPDCSNHPGDNCPQCKEFAA